MAGPKEKFRCKKKRCLANYRGRCALELEDMTTCIPAETNYLFRYGTIKTKTDAVRAYWQGRRYHAELQREAERKLRDAENQKKSHEARMKLIYGKNWREEEESKA